MSDLTKEQEKHLEKWRLKWWNIGVSTELADRPTAERVMRRMFELAHAGEPRFVWVMGPLEAKKAAGNETPTPFSWGGAEAHWLALYTFGEYLGVKFDEEDLEKLYLWVELVESCGYVYILDDGTCIMCERPEEFHMTGVFGELHNAEGPAIKCRDGHKVYSMNGVTVPDWLAETKPEDLDASEIAKIQNAEVRAQFVRKIGVERIYEKLGGKIIDRYEHEVGGKYTPYELVELKVPGMREKAVFLKMLNPSTEEIHMEGVPPDVRTCKRALEWRNPWGSQFAPVHLS